MRHLNMYSRNCFVRARVLCSEAAYFSEEEDLAQKCHNGRCPFTRWKMVHSDILKEEHLTGRSK